MEGEDSVEESLERVTQERDRLREQLERQELERLERLRQERDRLNDQIKSSETRQTRTVAVVGKGMCSHSCADHAVVMNSALWSTLPKEVLHLVFARLSVPDIVRLRCLSKEWDWNVTAKESEFRQTCASTKPSTRVFAQFDVELMRKSDVFFTLYYANSNRWYYMAFLLPIEIGYNDVYIRSMSASNRGLMCFYLRFRQEGPSLTTGIILVGNPLTSEWKTLPPIPMDFLGQGWPEMLQLVMDKGTKSYQIIVVRDGAPSNGVIIYNSTTGTWSSIHPLTGYGVFGYQYYWIHYFGTYHAIWMDPCALDCHQGNQGKVLENFCDHNLWEGVKSYALVRDHLFVLHESREQMYPEEYVVSYCISEYQGHIDSRGLHWVKLKVLNHSSTFEDTPSSYALRLDACEGFLMVVASNYECCDFGDYRQDLVWLYDMHVEKWCKIYEGSKRQFYEEGTLCELQRDAIP